MCQCAAIGCAHVVGVLFGALGANALGGQATGGQFGQPLAGVQVIVIDKPGAADGTLEEHAPVPKQGLMTLFDLLEMRGCGGVEPGVHRLQIDVFTHLVTEESVIAVGLFFRAVFAHHKFCFVV
ncbi:hypothetical protein D3C77_593710 [compost metagenome]